MVVEEMVVNVPEPEIMKRYLRIPTTQVIRIAISNAFIMEVLNCKFSP